jgi:hypothetical protein
VPRTRTGLWLGFQIGQIGHTLVLVRRDLDRVLGHVEHRFGLRNIVDSLEVSNDTGVTSTLFMSHTVADSHLDGARKVDVSDGDVLLESSYI